MRDSKIKLENAIVAFLKPNLNKIFQTESRTKETRPSYGSLYDIAFGLEKKEQKVKCHVFSRFLLTHIDEKSREIEFMSPFLPTDAISMQFFLSDMESIEVRYNEKNTSEYVMMLSDLIARIE
ncbi:MAG: hypothetical protein AAGI23_19825 [Bacteroidota bacterium]